MLAKFILLYCHVTVNQISETVHCRDTRQQSWTKYVNFVSFNCLFHLTFRHHQSTTVNVFPCSFSCNTCEHWHSGTCLLLNISWVASMGLRWQRGGSRGRKKLSGWIAGGAGGERRLWGEKICRLLVWGFRRLLTYVLSNRHSFIGKQRAGWMHREREKKTLTDTTTHRHRLSPWLLHTHENRYSSGYFSINLSGGNQNTVFNLQDQIRVFSL